MKHFSLTAFCALMAASHLTPAHEGHGPSMEELKNRPKKARFVSPTSMVIHRVHILNMKEKFSVV